MTHCRIPGGGGGCWSIETGLRGEAKRLIRGGWLEGAKEEEGGVGNKGAQYTGPEVYWM